MSVISNRQRAIDQLLHKDNIADCVSSPVKAQTEITVGNSNAETRTRVTKTPEDIKILAGALCIVEGSRMAAEISGLGMRSATVHAKGLETSVLYNPEFAAKVLEKKEELAAPIRERALGVILNAISTITPEKLEQAKLKEASSVAKDMASVIEKLADKNGSNGNSISFHYHAPRVRKEDEYVIKEV